MQQLWQSNSKDFYLVPSLQRAYRMRLTQHGRAIFCLALAMATLPADARVKRSHVPIHAFVKTHACPSTGRNRLPCPGYVIDHIQALACGGPDAASNLQWQTIAEGKAKDKWERKGCGK
jgi:hypothetical protein